MTPSTESYLTVRKHADALAGERHGNTWRDHRNKPLELLLPAIWLDQFDDENDRCLIFHHDEVDQHRRGIRRRTEQVSIRRLLWGCLGLNYWIPDAIRKRRDGEYLWQEIADLHWEDYDETWRRSLIEQVIIPETTFERWKAEHWPGHLEKRGRKPGSGSFERHDAPLIDEMKILIENGDAVSLWAAANMLAGRATGPGTLESKAQRLHRRFKSNFDQLKSN